MENAKAATAPVGHEEASGVAKVHTVRAAEAAESGDGSGRERRVLMDAGSILIKGCSLPSCQLTLAQLNPCGSRWRPWL